MQHSSGNLDKLATDTISLLPCNCSLDWLTRFIGACSLASINMANQSLMSSLSSSIPCSLVIMLTSAHASDFDCRSLIIHSSTLTPSCMPLKSRGPLVVCQSSGNNDRWARKKSKPLEHLKPWNSNQEGGQSSTSATIAAFFVVDFAVSESGSWGSISVWMKEREISGEFQDGNC